MSPKPTVTNVTVAQYRHRVYSSVKPGLQQQKIAHMCERTGKLLPSSPHTLFTPRGHTYSHPSASSSSYTSVRFV